MRLNGIHDKNAIEIHSISAGWIMGEFHGNNEKYFFNYSYMTNFLKDFMQALLYVHGEWEQDDRVNCFKTDWEPAIDRWMVELKDKKLYFTIRTYEDYGAHDYREQTELVFDDSVFLKAFVEEMSRVLHKFGLFGYMKEWGYEFPLSLLLKLKDIVDEMYSLQLLHISEEDNMGCDSEGTDICVEMQLLEKLLN